MLPIPEVLKISFLPCASLSAKTVAHLRVSALDQDIEKNKADILLFVRYHALGEWCILSRESSLPGAGYGRTSKYRRNWSNRMVVSQRSKCSGHVTALILWDFSVVCLNSPLEPEVRRNAQRL